MVPLSFAQRALWNLARSRKPATAYGIPLVLRIFGPLDRAALGAALGDVAGRHESLRTLFPSVDGEPVQRILPAPEACPVLEVVVADSADAVTGGVAEAVRRGFDPTRELPLRVRLLVAGPDEHVLVLVFHRVAVDGRSLLPFWRDLADAYRARCSGRPPGWPPLPVQYADYTLWQRDLLGAADGPGSARARQLTYWRQALAKLPAELHLPADRPRPAVPSRRAGQVRLRLDAKLHGQLTDLARECHVTLFMVARAALAVLLTRLGAGCDIPIGSPVAGRPDEALDDLVGRFANTLVLRTDTSGDPTFRDLLTRVRATDLAAYGHQDLPFERLVEELGPADHPARHPLFQVMLSFQDAEPRWELPGLRITPEENPVGVTEFDLSVNLVETRTPEGEPAGVTAEWEYATELFDRSTVDAMAARLTRLLEAFARSPDAPVGHADPGTDSADSGVAEGVTRSDGPGEVSAAQRRVWLAGELQPDNPQFNIAFGWRLHGPLDVAALRGAVESLVERHQVLASCVGISDGELTRARPEGAGFSWAEYDLSGLPARRARAEADAATHRAAWLPFDVAEQPLLRVRMTALGADEFVVLFVIHHLVFDAWSMSVFTRELAELYAASLADRAPSLPELPVSYQDFAAWQNAWLRGAGPIESLDYWRERLADLDPTELPTDFPRPLTSSGEGGTAEFSLGREVVDALKELSRREQVTLFMTLLGAFQLMLGRYCATDDVAVGTPIAGRGTLEVEGLIGLFFNPLVLRTDLSGAPGFVELIHRVRDVALGAYAHGDVPFQRIVEELRPAREPGRTPYFQAWFEMDNTPESAFALTALDATPLEVAGERAKFDLSMSLAERDGRVDVLVNYREDLFLPQTVDRFVAGFQALIADVVADAARPIGELAVISPPERARLVVEYNDTGAPVPDGLVHEWFERQALRRPGAVAVIMGESRWTFGEVNERANRLAHHLRAKGVTRENPVGVCVARGIGLVVTLLGVLKSGGAYVPMDPGFPPDRLRHVLDDTGAEVLVTEKGILERFAGYSGHVVRVDADSRDLAKESIENPSTVGRPDSLAYVIYTSGSTGRPKGVMIEHAGLANFVNWCVTGYAYRGDGGAPLFSSVAFDAVVPNLYTPLVLGQPVHILPQDMDPGRLGAYLVETGPFSFIKLTPSHLDLLAEQLTEEQSRALAPMLVVGAEAFPTSSLTYWQDLRADTVILNEYGPTEATVANSTYRISGPVESSTVPIGKPVPNTTMYVLDENFEPVPTGVTGELFIGGVCVARGYFRRPGLTAEKFVPDPFSAAPGSRLYRTGDLGRMLPSGDIEFIGRSDDQVKIRGYRIEPGEIEAVLTAHPAVSSAYVTTFGGTGGDSARLVAYLVGDTLDHTVTPLLRGHLADRLPDYMHPQGYEYLPAIPLTPHGKIDRKALPAPRFGGPAAGRGPRGVREDILCGLFAEVLGLRRVGVDDSFFDLGGHSLLAARLTRRINRVLGTDLTLGALFEAPSVARLGERLGEGGTRGYGPLLPIRPEGAGKPLFCVHPVWGLSWCYSGLTRNIDPGVPVHGLQAAGVLRADELPRNAEELIDGYVDHIIRRTDGPYRLLGWSMGGGIAHAVAVRLQRRGASVSFLALLDAMPNHRREPADGDEDWAARSRKLAVASVAEEAGFPLSTADAELPDAARLVEHINSTESAFHPSVDILPGQVESAVNALRLLYGHRPGVYSGDVVYFTAVHGKPAEWSPGREWARHIDGEMEIVDVGCAHSEMMDPEPVGRIGEVVGARLAALDNR